MVGTNTQVIEAKRRSWDIFSGVSRGRLPDDARIHTSAPVAGLVGDAAVNREITGPLHDAILDARWHPDLFLAGEHDDQVWVAHTGTIRGVFINPLWGIPASGRAAEIRYGEFTRTQDGQVIELRVMADLPGLAAQSGWHLFGDGSVTPSPSPSRARYDPWATTPDPAETAATATLLGELLADPGAASLFAPDHTWHGCHGVLQGVGRAPHDERAIVPGVTDLSTAPTDGAVVIADGLHGAICDWPTDGDASAVRTMRFLDRREDQFVRSWVLVDLIDAAARRGVRLLERGL
ncbi:MAG: hypothetical protein AAGE98_19450 [Actinomycetota bacterium]